MEILNQPLDGQLGQRLIQLLANPEFIELDILVAFAKDSGVLRLRQALEGFRSRGGKTRAYVGIDLHGTSYEALSNLLPCVDELYLVHSENSQTFHSKIYSFKGKTKTLVIIGSNNLTGGGLWTNFESAALIPGPGAVSEKGSAQTSVEAYINKLMALDKSFMAIKSQQEIELLLEMGYLQKEISQKIQMGKTASVKSASPKLFGKGVASKLPPFKSKEKSPPSEDLQRGQQPKNTGNVDTIWFETKALTGGSRNILDLSMNSLVERGSPKGTSFDSGNSRFMKGSVTFFGIDPLKKDSIADVTINFEGEDYFGNTVLFPTGSRSNGTWRIQIKGVSSSGVKITDAFRSKGKGPYLVNKILAMTKIQRNHYSLSVLEEVELPRIKSSSRIVARNGSSRRSKLMGII